jgi:hypothetical protein
MRDALGHTSDKFLLIIGPWSAYREDVFCESMARLAKLQERVL